MGFINDYVPGCECGLIHRGLLKIHGRKKIRFIQIGFGWVCFAFRDDDEGFKIFFFFNFKKMTQGVVIDIWPDFNRRRE